MKLAIAAAAVLLLAGCTRTVEATPVKAPERIDCNLIFPGTSPRA